MGRLEVICGPMFSGKSEELLRRLKRAQIAKRSFKLYKPSIDNRYSETHVVTHSGAEMECNVINDAEMLLEGADNVDIIAIDEAQFLGKNTPNIVEKLVRTGKRVIVAGLDMDYAGVPFGPIPVLLSRAEEVLKVVAVCEVCGNNATHTYKHNNTVNTGSNVIAGPLVLVGSNEYYEARCRSHWLN